MKIDFFHVHSIDSRQFEPEKNLDLIEMFNPSAKNVCKKCFGKQKPCEDEINDETHCLHEYESQDEAFNSFDEEIENSYDLCDGFVVASCDDEEQPDYEQNSLDKNLIIDGVRTKRFEGIYENDQWDSEDDSDTEFSYASDSAMSDPLEYDSNYESEEQ